MVSPLAGSETDPSILPRLLHVGKTTQPLRIPLSIEIKDLINNRLMVVSESLGISTKEALRDFEIGTVFCIKRSLGCLGISRGQAGV